MPGTCKRFVVERRMLFGDWPAFPGGSSVQPQRLTALNPANNNLRSTTKAMLAAMLQLLVDQPLLLLFAVLAVGFALGRLRLWGISLGVAAVRFAGLAAGALDERLQLPEIVQ